MKAYGELLLAWKVEYGAVFELDLGVGFAAAEEGRERVWAS